jgi:hypothetical protein
MLPGGLFVFVSDGLNGAVLFRLAHGGCDGIRTNISRIQFVLSGGGKSVLCDLVSG